MADEIQSHGKGRLAAVLAAVLVVVLVVGAVVLMRITGTDERASGASASASASSGATLDSIVPGEGGAAESVNVPGVGVDYADTCVGAAQAAGGWSTQVFGVSQAAAGVASEAFSDFVLIELVVADATVREGDPVMVTAATANAVAAAQSAGQDIPNDVAEFDRGGFRLDSCTAGDKAVVTVVGTVLTDGWSYSPASGTTTSEQPYREIRSFTYHLVSRDGSWRDQQLMDGRDALSALTAFGSAYVAADYVMTDGVRSSLKSDLGAGGHLYVSGS